MRSLQVQLDTKKLSMPEKMELIDDMIFKSYTAIVRSQLDENDILHVNLFLLDEKDITDLFKKVIQKGGNKKGKL